MKLFLQEDGARHHSVKDKSANAVSDFSLCEFNSSLNIWVILESAS